MAAFATLADLEPYVTNTGTRGTEMLELASALIRGFCRQTLDVASGTQESYVGDDERYRIFPKQRPITAVSAVTVDGQPFTEFIWNRDGWIERADGGAWSTGPIVITYDSGFALSSDEMANIRRICCEAAARALTASPPEADAYGPEVTEARGWTPHLFLTPQEQSYLADFGPVAVG